MQVEITPAEQQDLIALTTGKGRTKWLQDKAGISYTPIKSLKKSRQADEVIVKKVREVLKTKEARELIKNAIVAA